MSMTRDHGDIVFQCDGCNDTLETNTSNFEAAQNVLHRNRWRAVKRGAEWLHNCSTCQGRQHATAR